MRKKNLWKKTASVIIATAMVMTSVPVYAGTSDEKEDGVVIVQESTDEAEDEAVLVGDNSEAPIVALIGEQQYETLVAAVSAAKPGNTIKLLADVVNTGAISLPAGVTLDGNGKKITGNSSVYVNAAGGTVKNVNFENIHDERSMLSPIYASDITGTLSVTGCTFTNWDWDAIQTTPEVGAVIKITGNTFTACKGKNVHRAVHVESKLNTNFTITVTSNKFYGCQYFSETGLEVYYPTDKEKIQLSGNFMDTPMAVCIGTGYSYNNAYQLANPFKDKTLTNNIYAVAMMLDIKGNNKLFTNLQDAFNAELSSNYIYLIGDVVLTNDINIRKPSSNESGSINLRCGDYSITQENDVHIIIPNGVSVVTDKKNDVLFTAENGYEVYRTENQGEYTYTAKNEAVAECGGVRYPSLAEAINSAENGAIIQVLKDIDVSTTISIQKVLIINLNGNTITGKDASGNGVRVFQILDGEVKLTGTGTVQVKNPNSNDLSFSSSSVIRVGDNTAGTNPKLIVDKAVVVDTDQCYGISIFGKNETETLVVKGKIKTTDVPAISGNGSSGYTSTTITLEEGSEITTTNDYAIYHPQSGTLNINGKVEGKGGIEAKAGNTNVSVGENASITATAETPSHKENNNGTSTQGYAIAVVENNNYAGGAKVSIAGGTVTGQVIIVQDNNVTNDKKGSISITGGVFSEKPSENYLAPEHYVHKGNVSGKWGVSTTDGHNYNYKNNGYDYFCICGDSVYIPPYTPPQPTTPPATTDTVTNPDGSTTSTTTQENTDGSTTTTVVDKDSNGNVTGTTETTEKTTGNTTTKTETATTVDGAQTVTETTTVKNQDGSTEETKKVTDKDANGNVTGTTETVEKTEGNTTTTKETTTAADGSQTVTESTLVKNEDGSSEEKATIKAADGSVTNVTTTTQTDGSATEVKETSEKNDAGNTVDVTETKKINTEGTVTSVKEQSVIGNVADNTSATVNVLKDGEDNVKYSRATVNKTVDEDTTRVKLEGPVVDQIESASGTSNVTITMNVNTDDGDTKYSLKVATKNLQAGNKLYVYKENPETGERTMVNSLLYTVTEDGSVTFNTKQNANFVLVNKTTAAALNKAIKKTLTAAKPSSSVKAGKKIKMALNPNLNMENVKSVKYSTTQSSVAKVSSNGTITAKKAGIVSIKAMITLKNGYIKTVTTKITVKE